MELISNQVLDAAVQIGNRAPGFRAVTPKGSFYFPSEFSGNWVILYTCSDKCYEAGVVDCLLLNAVENEFEMIQITDLNHEIARLYHLKQPLTSNSKISNIAYLIDPDAIVRAIVDVSHLPVSNLGLWKQFISDLQANSFVPESESLNSTPKKVLPVKTGRLLDETEVECTNRVNEDHLCDCFFCIGS